MHLPAHRISFPAYETVFELDQVDAGIEINAAALYPEYDDTSTLVKTTPLVALHDPSDLSNQLCTFDDTQMLCFADIRLFDCDTGCSSANTATIINGNYYYGSAMIERVVKDIGSASPNVNAAAIPDSWVTVLSSGPPPHMAFDHEALAEGPFGVDYIEDGIE